MLTKKYSVEINSTVENVWDSLWGLENYKKWTEVFCEGSYAKTNDWKVGSRVHFLTPDGQGMYSDIAENTPFKKMDFRHIGNILNFEEQGVDDEETKNWSGAKEVYTLTQGSDNKALLEVEIDVYDKYLDYFETTFPKALQAIKNLAEK